MTGKPVVTVTPGTRNHRCVTSFGCDLELFRDKNNKGDIVPKLRFVVGGTEQQTAATTTWLTKRGEVSSIQAVSVIAGGGVLHPGGECHCGGRCPPSRR